MSKNTTPTVAEQVTEQLANSEWLTIKDIEAMGFTSVYIRKAIAAGKLEGHLEPIAPNSKTMHKVISRESFNAWRAGVGERAGAREDGRNKYVLYATPEEYARLMEKVAGEEYASLIKRANIKTVASEE